MVRSRPKHPQNRQKEESARRIRLALAQLPDRMHRAIRLFRQLTGFAAVTSLRAAVDDPIGASAISPPVHPRCASLLRRKQLDAPCEEQWRWHLRTGLDTRAAHTHLCPLGLRCSCVPIFYGATLVGIAKFVAGPETTDRRFSLAAQALYLALSGVCKDFHVAAITEELEGLRQQVAELRKVRRSTRAELEGVDPASGNRSRSLVDQALGYLGGHFLDPGLSLAGISRAMGVNGKYLTRVFTRAVGQHMRAYILGLRVRHACLLLLSTDKSIKEVAYESGFRRSDRFRRAFREQVGVAPASYRRIFTAS